MIFIVSMIFINDSLQSYIRRFERLFSDQQMAEMIIVWLGLFLKLNICVDVAGETRVCSSGQCFETCDGVMMYDVCHHPDGLVLSRGRDTEEHWTESGALL